MSLLPKDDWIFIGIDEENTQFFIDPKTIESNYDNTNITVIGVPDNRGNVFSDFQKLLKEEKKDFTVFTYIEQSWELDLPRDKYVIYDSICKSEDGSTIHLFNYPAKWNYFSNLKIAEKIALRVSNETDKRKDKEKGERPAEVKQKEPSPESHTSGDLHSGVNASTPQRKINLAPALICKSILLALVTLMGFSWSTGNKESEGFITIVIVIVAILTIIVSSVLHYRCWQALPIKYAKITPAKAVGYLFIPFYNFYWIFISYPELAKGFFKYRQSMGSNDAENLYGLSIAYSILWICVAILGSIPILGLFIGIAEYILFIMFYKKIVEYANDTLSITGEHKENKRTREEVLAQMVKIFQTTSEGF